MITPTMPVGHRVRSKRSGARYSTGHHLLTIDQKDYWTGATSKTEHPFYGHNVSVLVADSHTTMQDVVIPKFKSRSAAGEIFNNPMVTQTDSFVNPLVTVTSLRGTELEGRTYSTESRVDTLQARFPSWQLQLDGAVESAYDSAIVDAYAGITANVNNTALWLGEFKETVSMLFDVMKGTKALFDMTKRQRKKWKEGKLSPEGGQQLTLQLLYGILPLEQSIAQVMEGLFQVHDHGKRITSRGFRVSSDSDSYQVDTDNHWPFGSSNRLQVDIKQQIAETLEVTIRAGCLTEIDLTNTSFAGIIFDPKQVVSTAYALARLSFVVDWIINVGGTLAAWSPAAGVNVLSSFVSVEIKREMDVSTTFATKGYYHGPVVGGLSNKASILKFRKPIDRSDLVVIPPLDINLDIEKILAMVLLFAKVKKTI